MTLFHEGRAGPHTRADQHHFARRRLLRQQGINTSLTSSPNFSRASSLLFDAITPPMRAGRRHGKARFRLLHARDTPSGAPPITSQRLLGRATISRPLAHAFTPRLAARVETPRSAAITMLGQRSNTIGPAAALSWPVAVRRRQCFE